MLMLNRCSICKAIAMALAMERVFRFRLAMDYKGRTLTPKISLWISPCGSDVSDDTIREQGTSSLRM